MASLIPTEIRSKMHLDERAKRVLAKIYALQFIDKGQSPTELLTQMLLTDSLRLNQELSDLEVKGLVQNIKFEPRLTPSGRSAVVAIMVGGAFDIIHPGHLETLRQAKALGDSLVVSVARDSTYERNKKRKPHHNEVVRRELVSAIRVVDAAVLGSETNIFETVLLLKPDVIALGYDQLHSEERISEEIAKHGLHTKVVRLKSSNPNIKTTSIVNSNRDVLADI
jgi:cytidyltransferase-like protein